MITNHAGCDAKASGGNRQANQQSRGEFPGREIEWSTAAPDGSPLVSKKPTSDNVEPTHDNGARPLNRRFTDEEGKPRRHPVTPRCGRRAADGLDDSAEILRIEDRSQREPILEDGIIVLAPVRGAERLLRQYTARQKLVSSCDRIATRAGATRQNGPLLPQAPAFRARTGRLIRRG